MSELNDHYRRVAAEIYRLIQIEPMEVAEAVLEEVRRLKQAQHARRERKRESDAK